jgi:hypothetical protein
MDTEDVNRLVTGVAEDDLARRNRPGVGVFPVWPGGEQEQSGGL